MRRRSVLLAGTLIQLLLGRVERSPWMKYRLRLAAFMV